MKPTQTELEIQSKFVFDIVNCFKQWCKDNGTNLSRELNDKGKVHRTTISRILKGETKYLPLCALSYLASKTNLSLTQLANYKSETNIST